MTTGEDLDNAFWKLVEILRNKKVISEADEKEIIEESEE